ncbi:cholinephosphate cytidylyltransferase [Alteromonas australica]|uniref:phosphocholine cytidylyltransferase family protein n=1 Tax=Alteromonas TaxID=226 RepID=UPI0005C4240C|nr:MULTISPECIES: phosphocholine cytidylyltransferase family protein [Alteromonas]AJP43186.1 cholinephosphate cytidylyltransferase [Alteromonas australica]QPL49131.1 phosphocholine cytidylyltransferase family protein [Alteromonas sp. B31-7]|tara:strand:+ start:12818 stop:13534 length:717 start_codon:yes stop_codon:yes gene_type:complete
MKALLMAAGVGTRISRYLNGIPKCCVTINDDSLIKYTVDMLKKKGIDDIAIVTGYKEEYILKQLEGYRYTHFQNPFFDVTNSIASTWFSQSFLQPDDDYIIMNADVFIEETVIDILLKEQSSPLFLADSSRIEGADYRFNWKNNVLIKYGKELELEETTGEYVGIARIAARDINFFKSVLKSLIQQQKHDYWWEDIFYRSNDIKPVIIHDIKGNFWAEVDYIEDYERIKDYVEENFHE